MNLHVRPDLDTQAAEEVTRVAGKGVPVCGPAGVALAVSAADHADFTAGASSVNPVAGVASDPASPPTATTAGKVRRLLTDLYGWLLALVARAYLGTQSVTVATGAGTASAEIDLGKASAAGIILPADWTTSDITFKVCDTTGGTYQDLYNEAGAKITLASMQASWSIGLDAVGSALFAYRFVKIVSVSSQGGTKTIKIISKG